MHLLRFLHRSSPLHVYKSSKKTTVYGEIRASLDVDKLERYQVIMWLRKVDWLQAFSFQFIHLIQSHSVRSALSCERRPSGILLSKTAHQVEREYTVLHALQHSV
ncbi:hypothetical protein GGU11DRAFT_225779 [Lentinula aff. detonsa]|nr:hypothetical protein GGU11DRAFT_225779 [Lentinula aff. detonsa]